MKAFSRIRFSTLACALFVAVCLTSILVATTSAQVLMDSGGGAGGFSADMGGTAATRARGAVVHPRITGLFLRSGVAGNSVTITGTQFGATEGAGTVTFGATKATVSAWSATSIRVDVPSCLSAGTTPVRVADGAVSSNAVRFMVTSGTPCVAAGVPISSVLVGENDWSPKLPNSVWPIVRASRLQLVRIGGGRQDGAPLACNDHQGGLIQQIQMIRSAGAEPLIQVSRRIDGGNIGQLAAAAQAMVTCVNSTYVKNGTLSGPVQYWEIGNEPDLHYKGSKEALAAYVAAYVKAVAPAMRDADPNITIIAPALAAYNLTAYRDWLGGDDDISGTDSKGRYYIDAVSFHTYPFKGRQTMKEVLDEQSSVFPGILRELIRQINHANRLHHRTGAHALKYALTEFNIDYVNPKPNGIRNLGVCGFINGQLFASFYGAGMRMTTAAGYGALTLDTWSVNEGGGNCGASDLGFLGGDPGNHPTRRSSYYHMQMLDQYLLGGASPQYLKTTSSKTRAGVSALATTSNNRSQVAVMIMNEDDADGSVSVSLNGGTTAAGGDTKINVSAGIAKAYSYNVPRQSTMVLVYDGTGALKTQVTYSIENDEANQAPQVKHF